MPQGFRYNAEGTLIPPRAYDREGNPIYDDTPPPALSFAQNAKASLGGAARSVADAFLRPIESAKLTGQLALGTAQKMTGSQRLGGEDYAAAPEGFAATMGQRYGSPSKILNTALTDPFGMALDASMVTPALGGVAAALKAPAAVRVALRPVHSAAQAALGAAKDAAYKSGRWVVGSAMRPNLSLINKLPDAGGGELPSNVRAGIAERFYRESIPEGSVANAGDVFTVRQSLKGAEKLLGRFRASSASSRGKIRAQSEAGATVPYDEVFADASRQAMTGRGKDATGQPKVLSGLRAQSTPAPTEATKAELRAMLQDPATTVPTEVWRRRTERTGPLSVADADDVTRLALQGMPGVPQGMPLAEGIRVNTRDVARASKTTGTQTHANAAGLGYKDAAGEGLRLPDPAADPLVLDEKRLQLNRDITGAFGADPKNDPATAVRKVFSQKDRDALIKLEPSLAGDYKRQHELLELLETLRQNVYLAGNRNPVALYEFLGMLGGNPQAVGLGIGLRPSVLNDVGRLMMYAGDKTVKAPFLRRAAGAANLMPWEASLQKAALRDAILSQLSGPGQTER